MGVTTDPLCQIDMRERTKRKKKEVVQSEEDWKNCKKAIGRPRKKRKSDTTSDTIPGKSSSSPQSPCVETTASDCKTKSLSSLADLSGDHCEPTEKDVVFGKGRFIQNLAGNVKLRKLIKSHFDQYESADSPQDKTIMAMRLVVDIRESGGKFLKEDASAPGRYVEVCSITAREKIAATFHSHRRRSKQSIKMETIINESKHTTFPPPTSPEAFTVVKPSTISSMIGGAKAMGEITRSRFPGPYTDMELGLGSHQGKLFGVPPASYTSSLLQHGLHLSQMRAFELSEEMARIASSPMNNKMHSFKGSFMPVSDQANVERYTRAASPVKKSREQMGAPNVGTSLSSPIWKEEGMPPPWNRTSRGRLLSCAAISTDAAGKHSQAPSLASSNDANKVKSIRSSTSSLQRISSSRPAGTTSPRRVSSHMQAINTDSWTASCLATATEPSLLCTSQEALQAQLYREMGLPGF